MIAEKSSLVENNIGLAHSCVRRYTGRGIEYDDLFQTACVGLVKAAQNFDAGRGVRFSTYAVPVILGELRQLFRGQGSIRVSRSIKELGIKARRVSEEFFMENGRPARLSDIAAMLGVSEQDAAQALCAAQYPQSLDEGLERPSQEVFEEPATERLAVRQLVEGLSKTDRALITERYMNERTQSRTAALLGMTQVQVSRRERKILELMRLQLEEA